MTKKMNRGVRRGEDADELTRAPLQAILLADSFATLFRPISLERLKVLLPLVNEPMIHYTLSWLESAGVEEVFVFCCAHAEQVSAYLQSSKWFDQPNFSVSTIKSHNAASVGDALRLVYERNVIHGDFVLVTGDIVSNMSLTQALKEHKERRKMDSNAVMTIVTKQAKPSKITHQSCLGTDELFMAIDPNTKQLLYYEDRADTMKGTVSLTETLLADTSITLHDDKLDCYIDICSEEVLSIFTDNFDYQHLRHHFVKGLLLDDIMGYKIFTHEIHSSYAARVDNYQSYDIISKHIIERWTYPLVPDLFGNSVTKLDRQGTYRASDVGLSRSAQIGPTTVIGDGTTIGNYTEVSNSVIGRGCVIGSNVSIDGCYIWDNAIIEDGCKLKHTIACDGVIMKSGSVSEAGTILSFKVIIGPQFVVPAYSKVSLLEQPVEEDSDEELEYAGHSSGNLVIPSMWNAPVTLEEMQVNLFDAEIQVPSEVGDGGVGFVWSVSEGGHDDEWRHSVAPIPASKLGNLVTSLNEEFEPSDQDISIIPPSAQLDSFGSDLDEDVEDDHDYFQEEVEATFLRAVDENVEEDHVILEVNSLRLSYNLTYTPCAGALLFAMMKLALKNHNPYGALSELYENVSSVIVKWKELLTEYLKTIDDEIELILKFEEICLETEYSPLFSQILERMYHQEILEEEAILTWAAEKEFADESDKIFLNMAQVEIPWLMNAQEEEE